MLNILWIIKCIIANGFQSHLTLFLYKELDDMEENWKDLEAWGFLFETKELGDDP